jgi:hypothetical protein
LSWLSASGLCIQVCALSPLSFFSSPFFLFLGFGAVVSLACVFTLPEFILFVSKILSGLDFQNYYFVSNAQHDDHSGKSRVCQLVLLSLIWVILGHDTYVASFLGLCVTFQYFVFGAKDFLFVLRYLVPCHHSFHALCCYFDFHLTYGLVFFWHKSFAAV